MSRPSKKKLLAFLAENKVPVEPKHISYESYGRDTRAYIPIGTMNNRARLERMLTKNGFAVDRSYWPGRAAVEVKISFFKAHGWNA